MTSRFAITGAEIFDGDNRARNHALLVCDGKVEAILPEAELGGGLVRKDATGLLVAPGFIDLQVNGGGGVLFNNDPTVEGIRAICAAHARFGSTALLITLITDAPAISDTAVAAGIEAHAEKVPGFLGLHLEGPHLSLARKGTHDPQLIRPMTDEDLTKLIACHGRFDHGLLTIAPESVTPEQVRKLAAAGYTVSLGHTDTDYATAASYVENGVSMATHLFNAMSQLGNREPGMVGACLDLGSVNCGLIVDGFHAHPASMRIAMRAKQGPGRIFLVTDAMSTIGTDDTGFELNGRQVYRNGGRLTLADGTLAGADIDMIACVRNAHRLLGLSVDEAIRMATVYPAEAINATNKGRLSEGKDADFVLLTPELDVASTWIGGACVHEAIR